MLVTSLPEGRLDIIGDVHGEIEALTKLLSVLGYSTAGVHPSGRRLVFVGDLTDRGPDSPAVIDFVSQLVADERGYCVLGNHDLNLLLELEKHDNGWFYGDAFEHDGKLIPQRLADDDVRTRTLDFFRTLPVALERPGLRVVHAYWDQDAISRVRGEPDVKALFKQYESQIAVECAMDASIDETDQGLRHQNDNPVKLLTSGPERRVDTPFEASGKLRYEGRVKWWETHDDSQNLTVFGHYSLGQEVRRSGSAVCCDYGVSKRYKERLKPSFDGTYELRLAAIRVPEQVVVFDNGTQETLK